MCGRDVVVVLGAKLASVTFLSPQQHVEPQRGSWWLHTKTKTNMNTNLLLDLLLITFYVVLQNRFVLLVCDLFLFCFWSLVLPDSNDLNALVPLILGLVLSLGIDDPPLDNDLRRSLAGGQLPLLMTMMLLTFSVDDHVLILMTTILMPYTSYAQLGTQSWHW